MAISSYSSTFTTGGGTIIGEIQSISFSGVSAAEIDVTNLTSTAKAYVLGTMDGGTVDITCFTTNAAPTLPTSGATSPTSFVVRFGAAANGVNVTFSAFVVSTALEASVDGAVQTTYSLRISGAVTVAAA